MTTQKMSFFEKILSVINKRVGNGKDTSRVIRFEVFRELFIMVMKHIGMNENDSGGNKTVILALGMWQ